MKNDRRLLGPVFRLIGNAYGRKLTVSDVLEIQFCLGVRPRLVQDLYELVVMSFSDMTCYIFSINIFYHRMTFRSR
jgi:hypothetical protein